MPETLGGRKLLAHELTHVCQQTMSAGLPNSMGISRATDPVIQRKPAAAAPAQPARQDELRALRSERNELRILAGELIKNLNEASPEDRNVFREALADVQTQIEALDTRIGGLEKKNRGTGSPAEKRAGIWLGWTGLDLWGKTRERLRRPRFQRHARIRKAAKRAWRRNSGLRAQECARRAPNEAVQTQSQEKQTRQEDHRESSKEHQRGQIQGGGMACRSAARPSRAARHFSTASCRHWKRQR